MGGPDLASPDTQMGSEDLSLSFLYTDDSQTFESYYQKLNYVNVNISRLLKIPELTASESLFLWMMAVIKWK